MTFIARNGNVAGAPAERVARCNIVPHSGEHSVANSSDALTHTDIYENIRVRMLALCKCKLVCVPTLVCVEFPHSKWLYCGRTVSPPRTASHTWLQTSERKDLTVL